MGALMNAFGGGAGQNANAALSWGNAATGFGAVGDVASGLGGFQQASFNAALAARNAATVQQSVGQTLEAGGYEQSASLLRTGQLVASQKTAQAANGLDVNVGSPVAVRASTAALGHMDAAMIRYNASREAYGEQLQANALTAQATADRSAAFGSLASGFLRASGTLLSGASSTSAKWSAFKQSGAL